MRIPEKVVAEVVQEASVKMADPNYAQVLVGGWVQTQKNATQYLSAHVTELGGAEGVINAVFHAALIALCFQRHEGRSPRAVSFADLDAVADGPERSAELRRRQPAIHDYLEANVERPEMRHVLTLIALGLDHVT